MTRLVTLAMLALLLAGCATAPRPAAVAPPAEVATAPWAWAMPECVGYRAGDYTAPGRRLRVESGGGGVQETYQAGWGGRALAQIRQVLAECASYEYGGIDDPAAYREQNVVVENGFAGDESLLVRTSRLSPPAPMRISYAAAVRCGDLVSTARAEAPGAARDAAAAPCLEAGG